MKIMKNIMRLLLCSVILCLSSCGNSNKYYRYEKDEVVSDICLYEKDNTQYIAHKVSVKTKWGEWHILEYYWDIDKFTYENDTISIWVSQVRELAIHKRIS